MIALRKQVDVRATVRRAFACGQTPTLPAGFTGFSLDAANGLQLWKNGVLQAQYGSAGGAGVLPAYSGYQPVDSTHNCTLRFELPANIVNIINQVALSFSLKPFRATQQGTSAGGSAHGHAFSGQTTDSGSNTHSHKTLYKSGAGTDALSLTTTSGSNADGHSANASDRTIASQFDVDLGGSAGHGHGLSGVTSNSESSHVHNLNSPSSLYDTGMAQGVHVYIDGTDRTTALGGPWGAGSAIDVSDLDVSAYVTSTGWHEILLTSTTLGVVIAQVMTKAQLKTV